MPFALRIDRPLLKHFGSPLGGVGSFLAFLLAFLAPNVRAQSFVQVNWATPPTGAQVAVAYPAAQTGGNLNVVIVGWSDSTATVSSVIDSKGNVYSVAVGPMVVSGAVSQSIYYAKNIAGASAGANTVTVTFSTTASYPDIRILEYSGLDLNNPLDAFTGGVGSTTISDSGAVTTSNANDLLVGANTVLTRTTAAGTGYTSRVITGDGDVAEDQLVSAAGSYHATATVPDGGAWVMQVVAFKAAGATAMTAPSNLVATTASSTQINLSWTGSTETGGTISSYLVERCVGGGCTNFTQVGTSATTIFSDIGLASGTSYRYRRAGNGRGEQCGSVFEHGHSDDAGHGVTNGSWEPHRSSGEFGVRWWWLRRIIFFRMV